MSGVWRVLLLLCASPLVAEPVTTLEDHGDPNERIDVVVLGDGFTAGEQAAFRALADEVVDFLFADPPFKEYRAFFNVHAIEVVSNESGADNPDAGIERDTALGATYNCEKIPRLICVDAERVERVLARSLDAAARDLVLIYVNDTTHGGSSGGRYVVSAIGQWRSEIMLHEIGHSLGGLADEYFGVDNSPYFNCNREPSEPNTTRITVRDEIKWNTGGGPPCGWIEPRTQLPTLDEVPSTPGLYEGAKYCAKGVYRPTFDSKMRTLSKPWEAVNEAELVKVFYQRVLPIQSVRLPSDDLVLPQSGTATFAATLVRPTPDTLSATWLLNGDPVGTEAELVIDLDLLPGSHELMLVVTDLTAKVRSDPEGLLRQELQWELTIVAERAAGRDGLPDAFEAANGLAADAGRDGLRPLPPGARPLPTSADQAAR